jgi:hypothetical protein
MKFIKYYEKTGSHCFSVEEVAHVFFYEKEPSKCRVIFFSGETIDLDGCGSFSKDLHVMFEEFLISDDLFFNIYLQEN